MINHPDRSKFFLVIIALLLVANIGMLLFFLQKGQVKQNSGRDKKAFIVHLLQAEIGFNQHQLQQYDSLSNQHRQTMGSLYERMRTNKKAQFKNLVALNFSDSAINTVAAQSRASQQIIEINMLNHIKHIRMLCTPDQLPKFDTLFYKIFNRREYARKNPKK